MKYETGAGSGFARVSPSWDFAVSSLGVSSALLLVPLRGEL